jgi:hypothetical protein
MSDNLNLIDALHSGACDNGSDWNGRVYVRFLMGMAWAAGFGTILDEPRLLARLEM